MAIALLPAHSFAQSQTQIAASTSAEKAAPASAPADTAPAGQENAAAKTDSEVNAFFPAGNVISPDQKLLLAKEHEIVNQVPPAQTVSEAQTEPAKEPATTKPVAKTYNSLPYGQTKSFASNPLVSGEVRLAYRPATLDPMGEPVTKRSYIPAPDPAKREAELAKAKAKQEPASQPVVVQVEPPKKDEIPALNTFMEWVRSTQDAAEIARKEVEKKTQAMRETGSAGMYENDLFLTIRFPYTGAEPPPTNSATVYSVPPVVRQ